MDFRHRVATVILGSFLLTGNSVWAETSKVRTAAPVAEKEDHKGRVEVSGGLSGSEVASGSSVLYWVTVENYTNSTLNGVNVRLEVASDEFMFTCRLPASEVDSPGCGASKIDVVANQSITIQGEIRAMQGTEARSINAIITYEGTPQAGAKSVSSIRAASLGPLIARSWLRRTYDSVKDLILPAVLVLLGAYLTWKQNRFQAKLQSQDQEKQAERSQIAQTWTSMLPVSHELATQYYTPMIAATLRILLDLKRFTAPEDASGNANKDAVSAYFHLLLLWRRLDRTLTEKGGIYFKSRMGEKLVLGAIFQFRKEYEGETSTGPALTDLQKELVLARQLRVKVILRHVSPQMDLAQFMEIWEGKGPPNAVDAVHEGWADFVHWHSVPAVRDRTVKLLTAFHMILDFEMNRPYEKWYNSQEKLVDITAAGTLESLLDTEQERQELSAYLEIAKAGKPI
jgi:hypothetical protein